MFQGYSEKICRTDLKIKRVAKPQNFACDMCSDSRWITETDVELHRKEKHFQEIREQMLQNKDMFCQICMKLQDSEKSLIAHVKTKHLLSSPTARRIEREIFICNYCNNIFFNKNLLEVHIMNYHLWPHKERRNKMFICPKCKRNCKLKSIWFHLQLHEIPSISICDICLTNFENTEELEQHLKTHPSYFRCEICQYETVKEYHFESHLDGHHHAKYDRDMRVGKLERRVFRRSQENEQISYRYNIHHSLRGVDVPPSLIICVLCRELCKNKDEARAHLIRDHLKKEEVKRPFVCICGELFFNRVLLRHHVFKAGAEHRELAENEELPEVEPAPQYLEVEVPCVEAEGDAQMTEISKQTTEGSEEFANTNIYHVEEITNQPTEGNEEFTLIYAEVNEDELVTIGPENTETEVFGI